MADWNYYSWTPVIFFILVILCAFGQYACRKIGSHPPQQQQQQTTINITLQGDNNLDSETGSTRQSNPVSNLPVIIDDLPPSYEVAMAAPRYIPPHIASSQSADASTHGLPTSYSNNVTSNDNIGYTENGNDQVRGDNEQPIATISTGNNEQEPPPPSYISIVSNPTST